MIFFYVKLDQNICVKPDFSTFNVFAAGQLSNQRTLNSNLNDFLGLSSDSSRTEPGSSQSSETVESPANNNSAVDPRVSSPSMASYKLTEPRSVVAPAQKYNGSFDLHRKSWKQKLNEESTALRSHQTDELETMSIHLGVSDTDSQFCQTRPPNVSELVLPPDMDAAEVMTAYMRYPAQVHRIEAMRPLPRGRTISRGPPMVFGEPAPFNMKAKEVNLTEEPAKLTQRLEKSLTDPSLFAKHNTISFDDDQATQDDVIFISRDIARSSETLSSKNLDVTGMTQKNFKSDSQPLFVPRFVALPPQRSSRGDEEVNERGNLTGRLTDETLQDSNQLPFTVR